VLLIASAVLWMGLGQLSAGKYARDARETACELYSVMPGIKQAVPDDRVNLVMPIWEVDGVNFIGTVELPVYDTILPIAGAWNGGKVGRYPHRFTGSIYDGSLVVGGSDAEGQFDFMKLITGGDRVTVTDMTGLRFTCTVGEIEHTGDVSAGNLTSGEWDLVLFARNSMGFDYTVVRCTMGD